jgi:hypothetical protein
MKTSSVSLAIGAGYLLGRKRRLRLAIALAAVAATGRLGGLATKAAKRGGTMVGSSGALQKLSPDVGKVVSSVRSDLADAGKAAARAAIASRIETLTDSLHERAEGIRNPHVREETEGPEEQEVPDEPEEPQVRQDVPRPRGREAGHPPDKARRDSDRPSRRSESEGRIPERPGRREPGRREPERGGSRPRAETGSGSAPIRRTGR